MRMRPALPAKRRECSSSRPNSFHQETELTVEQTVPAPFSKRFVAMLQSERHRLSPSFLYLEYLVQYHILQLLEATRRPKSIQLPFQAQVKQRCSNEPLAVGRQVLKTFFATLL